MVDWNILKTEFVPEDGETVRWYTCGPTVYDEAHVGHARNYVQADIVRRVMEDYFRYNVIYVMNITDVDDKIIIKSHLEYLRLLVEAVTAAVGCEGQEAPTSVQKALSKAIEIANDPAMEKNMVVLHEAWKNLKDSLIAAEVEFEFPKEPDFRRVAKKYEMEFMEDMRSLGVRDPSALTRVTEFIPRIVEFVEGIVKNGFAYVSNGSVYFDTIAFMKSHDYGKLQPESVGDVELFEEAEGALSLDLGEKRCSNDFALWKKSKEGEPAWDSPWGVGRPGWHIECSTMATHVLGKTLDIHSGGVDLRFPHHDNEIAQSEAFFNSEQWVNYFIHVGHLHIEGFKMSRSKKNFFSIRQVLQTYTARQIRMFCLLRRFEAPVDYSKETMDAAVQLDKFFGNFFQNIKVFLRKNADLSGDQLWKQKDFDLHKVFVTRKGDIDAALKDSINTPVAVTALQDVVKAVNVYLTLDTPLVPIIRDIAGYISKMFRIFGFFDVELWPAGDEISESVCNS
jgi:cysteinyl-tRNA synthetase